MSISVLVLRIIVLVSNGLIQLLRDFGNRYDHRFGVVRVGTRRLMCGVLKEPRRKRCHVERGENRVAKNTGELSYP